jgi:acyl-CoA hydrolase
VGDVIVFEARILNLGTTSVQIEVIGAIEGSVICTAGMTFVNIGPDGKKLPL